MKIGDEVCVHGYIDEIRNDVVIIRNAGGYFGTDANEILSGIESWNGMLGQAIAPKGTFERIFNDDGEEDVLC